MSDLGKAEILQQIKVAEEKVRGTIRDAEEKRKQLQAEGKRAALEMGESAEAALQKEAESRVSEARARTEAKKRAIMGEGSRKAEALVSNARRRTSAAKEYILSEFERAVDA